MLPIIQIVQDEASDGECHQADEGHQKGPEHEQKEGGTAIHESLVGVQIQLHRKRYPAHWPKTELHTEK